MACVSSDDCENICKASYHHNWFGNMNSEPLFRISWWNNGLCCMFYDVPIIISITHNCVLKYTHDRFCFIFVWDLDDCMWPVCPYNSVLFHRNRGIYKGCLVCRDVILMGVDEIIRHQTANRQQNATYVHIPWHVLCDSMFRLSLGPSDAYMRQSIISHHWFR